jgi:CRP-like cAMP-binding protein
MTKGEIVGEIAFFSGIPRTFTVTAGSRDTAAFVLEKSFLKRVLRREKIDRTLQLLEILSPLSDEQRSSMYEKSNVMTYAAGSYLRTDFLFLSLHVVFVGG